MTDKLSDKDKKDWENFLKNPEKIEVKDDEQNRKCQSDDNSGHNFIHGIFDDYDCKYFIAKYDGRFQFVLAPIIAMTFVSCNISLI